FPWSEKHYSEAVWGRCDHLAALTKHEISLGFIQGSSVQKMAKHINDVMGSGKYAAERLVRTECSYFAGQGELAAYKENGISKYRFLGGSEGSSGGCHCAELNGQVFSINAADPGVNYPPMHPNCLCTTVAYFSNSVFDASADAKPLPANTKFKDWKKEFVDTPAIPAKMSLTEADQRALKHYIS
ncbi:MAG: minor capsid protein, partial [Clostridiales bacterium]